MTTLPIDTYIDPFIEGFTFTPPVLADGMRLSTACVTRRVIEYAFPDDERYVPFNEGVGRLGHMLAQVWAYQAFRGACVEEYPVAWAPGEHTHLDVVAPDESCWYEVKTTSSLTTPSTDQFAQVKRQHCALLDSGKLPGARGKLILINKTNGWVSGPWTVPSPTDDEIAQYRHEVAQTLEWAQIVSEQPERAESDEFLTLCSCNQCRIVPRTELTGELADLLDYTYHDHAIVLTELKEVKLELDAVKDQLKLRLQPGKYESGFYNVSLSEAGRLTIRAKKQVAA